MRRRWLYLAFLALLVPNSSHAQWTLNGSPLTTVPDNQWFPAVASDGAGGTLVTWSDRRFGILYDIYVQKVDETGAAVWSANGVLVCDAVNSQEYPSVVSDGAGGAIVTWADYRTGTADVYAQRVNAAGVVQWAANGVVVSTATSHQEMPLIVSDGAGGAVIAWRDFRNGNYDLYTQRINAAGVVQWAANGVALVTSGGDQISLGLVSDGAGGAIATWEDYRWGSSDIDIYAQRVNAAGTMWVPNGISLCSFSGNQTAPAVASDGSGGAVFAWQDFRGGAHWDIYSQRVNAGGAAQWPYNGVALCTYLDNQKNPEITTDGAGGAVVVWEDERGLLFMEDLYAQRVSATGATLWTFDGVVICDEPSESVEPTIVADGKGGVIVAWNDWRASSTATDVFAQRLDASGVTQWTHNGVSVSTYSGTVVQVRLVADGKGGSVLAWTDYRGGYSDIYAQRLDNVYGFWGHPEPIVESAEDIPHDQGGKVAVDWTASGRDLPNPRAIDFYSVWRAVDAIPSGAAVLTGDDLDDLRADDNGPVYLATPEHYFERVGTQTAHGWPGYSFSAATRADSVAAADGDEVFMVAAHVLYDNYVAFASNELTGHSVDNLAPLAPFLLTAQRVGSDVHLNWNRAVAPDLRDYAVYRATSSGVTPVPINFLASSNDTIAVDPNAPTNALYYIVTAYDVHANQSAPSNEASVGALTNVGNTPALTTLTVQQNHPNPFQATTDFAIGLPASADVSIEIFDVAGRRVSALNAQGVKGWQRIPFAGRDERGQPLASGVYFYRVNVAGATMTRKMVIAR